jgi:hypothetical protein
MAMLQSAKPCLQRPTVHIDISQPPNAFGASHTAPHAPQFPGLSLSFTSQPSSKPWLQSANPGEHETPHEPATHVALPFTPNGQGLLQPPQL